MEQFERYFKLKNGGQIMNYTPLFDLRAAVEVIIIKLTDWLAELIYIGKTTIKGAK